MDKQHFLVFMVLCLTSVLACDPGGYVYEEAT